MKSGDPKSQMKEMCGDQYTSGALKNENSTAATGWCVFLMEEATRRILLLRVGGRGYRFIHELFREYLVTLDMSQETSLHLGDTQLFATIQG